ncbi:hypothetical protein HNP02_003029 [Mycobacterium sp. AZCC_0083]|nr:hypothetical protein [Mycobacterium sp. AZCC_0083]
MLAVVSSLTRVALDLVDFSRFESMNSRSRPTAHEPTHAHAMKLPSNPSIPKVPCLG